VLSPWLNRVIGVPGIFALTGVLVLVAMWVVYAIVPDVPDRPRREGAGAAAVLMAVVRDTRLAHLYYGVFALHAVLMALFIAVPLNLRAAGLPVDQHWQVYLPVMAASFLLMLPAVLGRADARRTRAVLVGSIVVLLLDQLAMPWLSGGVWSMLALLVVYFTPFNVLEAVLPAQVSRLAAGESRGMAIGVFATLQFLGAFCGAAAGGYLYERWATPGVVIFNAILLVIWLMLALGTRARTGGQERV
jgi:predicted MFS family arabinose efflux permease